MSTRQIRRLREQLQAAKMEKEKQEEEEKDEFEPLYVNKHKPSFELLVPDSSTTEEEQEPIENVKSVFSLLMDDSDEDPVEEVSSDGSTAAAACASTRKKKRNNKKKNRRNSQVSATEGTSETDEIERAVAEVNSILGEPEKPSGSQQTANDGGVHALLKVNHKNLSMEEEFDRRFGPDDEEPIKHQRPNMHRLCRRHILLPLNTPTLSIKGLEMVLIEQIGEVKYFKYEHSSKYQDHVRGVIADVKFQYADPNSGVSVVPNTSIEGILQNIDLDFMMEELDSAITMLEAVIACLQKHFCPSFNYYDGKTRLEYKYVENRPFHIALLKYIYMITRRACHRTALEISKLLLSLDPSDPLAVIFLMDSLALRARDYQWLVDIYQHWQKKRDAKMLFHLEYSHALAKYHIYLKTKNQDDLDEATKYLREAMTRHPNVAILLMAYCCVKNPTITEHDVFKKQLIDKPLSKDLQNLQELYVTLSGHMFREGKIMKWFTEVALKLTRDYDDDPVVQQYCNAAVTLVHSLFIRTPIEIKRHMFVIRAMAKYLFDDKFPKVMWTYSFNPYPHEGVMVDSPLYFKLSVTTTVNGWRFFLASFVPEPPAYEYQG